MHSVEFSAWSFKVVTVIEATCIIIEQFSFFVKGFLMFQHLVFANVLSI